MKAFCASCRTELEPFEKTCPVCMRERTREELFNVSGEEVQPVGAAKQGGGLLYIFVGIGVVAGGLFLLSQKMIAQSELESRIKMEEMRKGLEVKLEQEKKLKKEAVALAKRLKNPEKSGAALIGGEQGKDDSGEMESIWTVQGDLYDMLSLKPVGDAHLVFKNKLTGKIFKTKTNGKGRYLLRLPRIQRGGYVLSIKHRYYDGKFIEDMDYPYKQQSKENRVEAIQFRDNIVHAALLPPLEEEHYTHHLVMLPKPRR